MLSIVEIHIGSETDAVLFKRLQNSLRSMGGELVETSWVLGGSQVIITYKAVLKKGTIEIISETYVGLLIRGEAYLVYEVIDALNGLGSPQKRQP